MGRRNRGNDSYPTLTQKEEKFILTNEDWYPTREDGRVRVLLMGWTDGAWRVLIIGNDDFELEKRFIEENSARQEFKRIVDLTTQKELKSRGFQ